MRHLPLLNLIAWLWLAVVPVSVTFGAALANQSALDGERFLFVVDMSADMEKLQAATEATLFDLIGTGIHGYMKPGDTFGMWTFNKEMTAGKFAMQTWDPRRAKQQATMAAAVAAFVRPRATLPRRPMLHRESSEPPQLDPVAACQGLDDLVENDVVDLLHVLVEKVLIGKCDALDQLRLDHPRPSPYHVFVMPD